MRIASSKAVPLSEKWQRDFIEVKSIFSMCLYDFLVDADEVKPDRVGVDLRVALDVSESVRFTVRFLQT